MNKLIIAAVALLAPSIARADVIADWTEAADDISSADVDVMPGQPNFTKDNQTTISLVSLAMFEAANAADRRYRSFLGLPQSSTPASPEAAAASAAHAVMVAKFKDKKEQLDEALALHLGAIEEGPKKAAGIALGQSAAKAVLAREVFDEKMKLPGYKPFTTPGRFVGTAIPTLAEFSFAYRPWFLNGVDAIKPPTPPALASERYSRDYEETRRMGAKSSSARTPAQTANAKFWARANYPFHTMRAISAQPGRSVVQNARFYALMNLASDDAGYAHAVAKLKLMAWRPITAIRNGDEDGNNTTVGDPSWEPLLRTPNQPEYPCGHCIYAGVTAVILEAETGPKATFAHFKHDKMPAAGASVRTWEDYVRQVNESRIQAGAHFRFSTEAGTEMGYEIARIALKSFAAPLSKRR